MKIRKCLAACSGILLIATTLSAKAPPTPQQQSQSIPEKASKVAGQTESAPPPASQATVPSAQTRRGNPLLSPTQERQRIMDYLGKSRSSGERWTSDAAKVFSRWHAEAVEAAAGTTFSRVECFEMGCTTTATYSDLRRYQVANQSLSDSDVFQNWPGPKYRSAPEVLTDGKVVVQWVLFRPDAK
jgi:hypothetical protein